MKLIKEADKLTATNTGANADKVAISAAAAIITTTPLTTAIGVDYVLTVFGAEFDPMGDGSTIVFAGVRNGSNSAGSPSVRSVQVALGVATVIVRNIDAANPLNGTLIVSLIAFN